MFIQRSVVIYQILIQSHQLFGEPLHNMKEHLDLEFLSFLVINEYYSKFK